VEATVSTELVAGLIGIAVFLLIVIWLYNRLVRLRYAVRSSWADIDVHLRKRYELVPNLVETVQGYAVHERDTLAQVTELRAAAMRAGTPTEKARAENMLTQTLRSMFALVEAYPDLKANGHFQDLMKQTRELEDNIEYARRYYNASVREYNVATAVFPSGIVASAFAFAPEEFFELAPDADDRKGVKVSFARAR
jgi:LemA protein